MSHRRIKNKMGPKQTYPEYARADGEDSTRDTRPWQCPWVLDGCPWWQEDTTTAIVAHLHEYAAVERALRDENAEELLQHLLMFLLWGCAHKISVKRVAAEGGCQDLKGLF